MNNSTYVYDNHFKAFGISTVLVLMVGIASNVIALFSVWNTICTRRSLLGGKFFANQFISGFLFLLLTLPFHAYTGLTTNNYFASHPDGRVCGIIGLASWILLTENALSHAVLALNRLLVFVLPKADNIVDGGAAHCLLIFLSWLISVIIFVSQYSQNQNYYGYNPTVFHSCWYRWTSADALSWRNIVVVALLPAVTSLLCYVVILVVRKYPGCGFPGQGDVQQLTEISQKSGKQNNCRRHSIIEETEAARSGCVMAVVFFVFYTPAAFWRAVDWASDNGRIVEEALSIAQWAGVAADAVVFMILRSRPNQTSPA